MTRDYISGPKKPVFQKVLIISMIIFSVLAVVAILFLGSNIDTLTKTVMPTLILLFIFLCIILYFICTKEGDSIYFVSRRNYFKKISAEASVDQTSYHLTDAALHKLPNEYIIISGYRSKGLSFDNIVIGHTGIFLVLSNNYPGTVDNISGSLIMNNTFHMDLLIQSINTMTLGVVPILRSYSSSLTSILCFTKAQVNLQSNEHFEGVLVLSVNSIEAYITTATPMLNTSEIKNAYTLLSEDATFTHCRNIPYPTQSNA